MSRTLIIYDSKYGSSEEAARKLALILGPARCLRPEEFTVEFGDNFEFVVIIVPVYNEIPYPTLTAFVEQYREWLGKKRTALVSVALATGAHALHYLEPLAKQLGDKCVYNGSVGGRLVLNRLDEADLKTIKTFYGTIGQEVKDADTFNLDKFLELAFALKACAEACLKTLPPAEVRTAMEDFLKEHNTCTLCTGYNDTVRATPIEYRYQDGYCYFVTEGGEKFAGIFKNQKVNIAVYEPYKGRNTVAGLVVKGEVTDIFTDPLSEDYQKVSAVWNLNVQKVAAMAYRLNGLVVKLGEAEFFWVGFEKAGSSLKQFYHFDPAPR